jgi:hypothetical protein
MSFDLAVWYEPSVITADAAQAMYGELCRQDPPAKAVPTHPQVTAFYQDLIKQNPRLSSLSAEQETAQSPWATELGVLADSVIMSIVWPQAERVVVVIRELAERHGLVCYDPQQSVVHHPPALRTGVALALSFCDGSRFDDPDPAAIDQALRRLSRHNWFAVLERDNWYVQVGYGTQAGTRSGWYALERRDGAADQHFRTELSDINEIITAFTGFAGGEETWQHRFAWRKVDF